MQGKSSPLSFGKEANGIGMPPAVTTYASNSSRLTHRRPIGERNSKEANQRMINKEEIGPLESLTRASSQSMIEPR
jgi:hypothetical protein